MDASATVRDGYRVIAERYHAGRLAREAANVAWLDGLRAHLPPSGRLVDLGCGAGVPIARYFADRGYAVEGYDISPEILAIARREVPDAEFYEGRMEEIELEPGSVDLVTSLFAIIHVPRGEHEALFRRIYRWLRPGGAALLGLGADDNPLQEEEFYGAPMVWSHFGAEQNLEPLRKAGFAIESSETEEFGSTERHLFVIVRRPNEGETLRGVE